MQGQLMHYALTKICKIFIHKFSVDVVDTNYTIYVSPGSLVDYCHLLLWFWDLCHIY